ncbi:MAG: transporter [Roseivirga sp.]|nr:transporter [Roseivirga sp.]
MAQSDTTALASDRPTQTASAFLIPKGMVQIESGFSRTTTKLGFDGFSSIDLDVTTYNSTQVRFGVSNNLELLFSQSLVRAQISGTNNGSDTGTQLAPTGIGVRFRLFDMNDRGRPQTAFLVNFSGPWLTDAEGSSLDLRFNMQHNLGEAFSLGYNIGGVIDDEFNSFVGTTSVVFGYVTSARLSVFAEFYMTFPELADSFLQSDFGLLYSVNPNFQIDVFAGLGISQFTPDSLIGAGVAIRIPGK